MIIAHGNWLTERSAFFLWGEELELSQLPSVNGAHPFGLEPERVNRELYRFLGSETQEPSAWQIDLRLPSVNGGPTPSIPLGDQPSSDTHRPTLRSYRVSGMCLDPLTALRWLVALPTPSDMVSFGIQAPRLGPDLQYWSELARFTLELLAKQKFLPGLSQSRDLAVGRWEPLLENESDRLDKLIRAMPPVCRAINHQEEPDPEALVRNAVATLMDAFIRRSASRLRLRPRFVETPGEQFLQSVLVPDSQFNASDELIVTLREGLQSWRERLTEHTEESFRLAFRMEAPKPEEELDSTASSYGKDLSFHLHYFLQAVDDDSLMVPLSQIWEHSGQSWEHVNRRMERPQERVLTELARAATLFEPIGRSLTEARPGHCELSVAEAHDFLTEASVLLKETGFSVQVPTWWGEDKSQLGVRLRVRPVAGGGDGDSTLGLSSLVSFDWQVALGDERLEHSEFLELVAQKQPLVRVRGQWVELVAEQVDDVIDIIRSREAPSSMTLAEVLKLRLRATNQKRVPLLGLEAEDWVQQLLDTLTENATPQKIAAPDGFQGQLRPYQNTGLAWLNFMGQFGLGACLADDMGLGKTIQVLALLLHQKKQRSADGPCLVVCPTSIISNWRKEAERFTPELEVHVHHGIHRLSGQSFKDRAMRSDLVISTYSLIHRDFDELTALSWGCLVLDEAQNIKNTQAKQTKAVRRLSAPRRLALTGTPVENRLSELWSIMEFLNPGYLGSEAAFKRQLALPIERYRDPNATAELSELVRPFLMRRLKTDPDVIRDLPEKNEMKVYCTLTREQVSLYQAVVRESLNEIDVAEGIGRRGEVLRALTRLKQICNHPAHYLADGSQLEARSGKLTRLEEMLEEVIAEGDRALVFTQYAEMGKLLQRRLQQSFSREVLYLHGGVPAEKREEMIVRFQESEDAPSVFVLSLKAGGFGLNLTQARHVFHFDRWWNPAVEDQATDRVFRIGQTKSVAVHKFICAGTIEERIDELIERKKELAHLVISAGDQWLTELTTSELRDLFELRDEVVGV